MTDDKFEENDYRIPLLIPSDPMVNYVITKLASKITTPDMKPVIVTLKTKLENETYNRWKFESVKGENGGILELKFPKRTLYPVSVNADVHWAIIGYMVVLSAANNLDMKKLRLIKESIGYKLEYDFAFNESVTLPLGQCDPLVVEFAYVPAPAPPRYVMRVFVQDK